MYKRTDSYKKSPKRENSSKTEQIEGRNPVIELIRSRPNDVIQIYLQKGINIDEKIAEINEFTNKRAIVKKEIDRKSLDKLSQTGVHQGVIAITGARKYLTLDKLLQKIKEDNKEEFLVLIRETLYEHNLGAILRTAACAGVNGVIITPESEVSPNVVRAAMGATEYLAIAKSSIFDTIKRLKSENIRVLAIEQAENSEMLFDANLVGPICLIIGGEDHPVSADILNKCDGSLTIPMFTKVNSLNMSVAFAVVAYEKVRQEVAQ